MNTTTLKTNHVAAPGAKPRSFKDRISKGRIASPVKMLVFGTEGAGKSTFAAGAPDPIFVNFDNRTNHLDVERIKPRTWDESLEVLHALEVDPDLQSYKTIVLDPLGWWETLCHLKVTGDPLVSIDAFDGGYGRGASAAMNLWRIALDQLDRLWEQGKNIICVAHVEVKGYDDPRGPKYDKFQVALKDKAAGRFRQWCDYVTFAEVETIAKAVSKGQSMKGVVTDRRLLHLKPHGAYDAKFSGSGPAFVELSWNAFFGAVQASTKKVEELRERILATAAEIGDPAVTQKLTAWMAEVKDNGDRLEEIANAAAMKLAAVQATKTENKEG